MIRDYGEPLSGIIGLTAEGPEANLRFVAVMRGRTPVYGRGEMPLLEVTYN
jgi:hypothetical protein